MKNKYEFFPITKVMQGIRKKYRTDDECLFRITLSDLDDVSDLLDQI